MHLNRFKKTKSTCIDVWVLQNWLQVDESRSNIDIFYFQINSGFKYTYTYYSHNISKFLCKIYFEHLLIS
jgi:hypothetical protein